MAPPLRVRKAQQELRAASVPVRRVMRVLALAPLALPEARARARALVRVLARARVRARVRVREQVRVQERERAVRAEDPARGHPLMLDSEPQAVRAQVQVLARAQVQARVQVLARVRVQALAMPAARVLVKVRLLVQVQRRVRAQPLQRALPAALVQARVPAVAVAAASSHPSGSSRDRRGSRSLWPS